MAIKVVWTEPAIDDVRAIRAYIARDSVMNADHLAERFLSSAEDLGEFPLSGRIVPEWNQKEIREVIIGAYRLVYRIKRGTVQILRVSHSARLLKLK